MKHFIPLPIRTILPLKLKLAAVPQAENSEPFHVPHAPWDTMTTIVHIVEIVAWSNCQKYYSAGSKNVSAHKLVISGSMENVVFLHVTYAP